MSFSLKHKVVLLIVLIALVLSTATITVSTKALTDIVRKNYENYAERVAHTTAAVVDSDALARLQSSTKEIYDSLKPEERVSSDDWGSDEFYEYLSHFETISKTKDYQLINSQLHTIQDNNHVDCVYTCYVDPDTEKFIYLVDAADEEPCPIGCFDPLYEQNRQLLKDPTIGFPTYTTNTKEYGYLATSGVPVYNSSKKVVGYAMVDVSMDDIASERHKLLSVLIGMQVLITIMIVIISIILVNRMVVDPVNRLSQAARDFCQDEDMIHHNHFSSLDIHTNDEITDLAQSMKHMEQDLNDKISNLLQTRSELTASRNEVDRMNEIALKDALTGVHNKRAYDSAMHRLEESVKDGAGSARFGLAVIDLNGLKAINDTYGHEKGDIAIKKLCGIVCNVFSHSPIYRIGGDEFVVILKNHDLRDIEKLMTEFNSILLTISQNADLPPWEQVSASIGYASYDADRDGTPDGTFRRADRAMYLRKQQMKQKI